MTKELFIPDEKTIKEFYDCLRMEILKPNRLSELEIEKLCKEFLDFVPLGNPYAKIKKGIYIAFSSYLYGLFSEQYNMLVDIVNKYTYLEYHIPYMEKRIPRIPVIRYNTDIVLPFRENIYNHSACGLLNRHFYKLMYYIDFLNIKITSNRLKQFWNFYKKTLNVYALQYEPLKNTIFIVPKPDEIFIKDGITHCLYNTVEYYCDGISVPSWLYKAKKEELLPEDFAKIENVDVRTIFLKKAGIEKFISKGKIIDTFENYPDNEWWAKSEYKLIDMKKILIKRYSHNNKTVRTSEYNYAPFLCMKNQTTGEYHLEGVSPDCKNLYDALKMRYKGLNLIEYDFKEIK